MRFGLRALAFALHLLLRSVGLASAQADLGQAAIAAQVQTPGGCRANWGVDSLRSRFFPRVRFLHATCTREHGDPEEAYVGIGAGGQIHILASPIAFDFLRRVEPPLEVGVENARDYAVEAIRYSGKWIPRVHSVSTLSELPPGARRRLHPASGSFGSTTRTPAGRFRVVVYAASTALVIRYDVFVGADGQVLALRDSVLWGVMQTR